MWKCNPGKFKTEHLNLEIIIETYYLDTDNHVRNKVKVVLQLSKYVTSIKLEHATGVDTSDLAAKK